MAVSAVGVTVAVTNTNVTAYTVPPGMVFRLQNIVGSTQEANDSLTVYISTDATIDDADLIWDRVIFPNTLPFVYELGCVLNAGDRLVLKRGGSGTVNMRVSGVLETAAGPST